MTITTRQLAWKRAVAQDSPAIAQGYRAHHAGQDFFQARTICADPDPAVEHLSDAQRAPTERTIQRGMNEADWQLRSLIGVKDGLLNSAHLDAPCE